MATSSTQPQHNNNNNNKPVTGYPAQPMTGYPSTTATGTATAYAYPYPPPQPQPQQNAYYQTHQPPVGPTYYFRQSNGPTVLRRLIIAGIVLFVIMGIIFFISWIVLKPRFPEFRVDSATVSQLNNVTQSQLTATWAFTLFVSNPNHKLAIYYDNIQASVYYRDDSKLGDTQLAPFEQGKRNETTVPFQVSIINAFVGADTVKRINVERASGSVDFGVKLMAYVRFSAGVWRMRVHLMSVFCDPLNIAFSNNNGTGTLLGQSKPCQVFL